MKKLTFIVFIFLPIFIQAQTIVKGIITEQNSGNKPISSVQLKAAGANPEVSDNAGNFRLNFSSKKSGDKIMVFVSKTGYEIVNKKEIENWYISNDPNTKTKIVMCPEGLIAENMLKYYEISYSILTQKHDEKIKDLQVQLKNSTIDNENYENQLNELKEKYNQQQQQLEELADKFARENFDDCSTIQKQAFETFKSGDIEGAIKILESVNSEEEIRKANQQKVKGGDLVNEGKKMQEQADSIIQTNISKLIFQADLYVTNFQFADAYSKYKEAVVADTTNFNNVFTFAKYLSTQNKANEAIEWYKVAYKYVQYPDDKALILNNFALEQSAIGNYDRAEEYFNEALNIWESLLDSSEYDIKGVLANLFISVNNLADIASFTGRKNEAKEWYLTLIDIFNQRKDELQELSPIKANIYNNLSLLQIDLEELEQAKQNNENSISIYAELINIGQAKFENELANAQNNQALIEFKLHEFNEAEGSYLDAIQIYSKLSEKNPEAYEAKLAKVLMNLGQLQTEINKYSDAEENFTKALEIFKKLYKINPKLYRPDFALLLNNYAVLKMGQGVNEKAVKYYQLAIKFYKVLAKNNPEGINPTLATVLSNYGMIQTQLKDYIEAESSLESSLNLFKNITNENPYLYNGQFALAYNNMAVLKAALQQYDSTVVYLERALEIYKKLQKQNPNAYIPDLAKVYSNIGVVKRNMGDYDNSIKYLSVAINYYSELCSQYPALYLTTYESNISELVLTYKANNDYVSCENVISNAVSKLKQLYLNDSIKYALPYAEYLNYIAVLQADYLKKYKEAEKNYKMSLSLYERLVQNDLVDKYSFANVLYNLALLYKSTNDYSSCAECYKKVINIYSDNLSDDTESNKSKLVILLNELALLQSDYLHQYDYAEENYYLAISIINKLANAEGNSNLSSKATIYSNLGILQFKNLNKIDSSLYSFKECVNIYKILCKVNPNDYQSKLYGVYDNISYIYNAKQDIENAILTCTESLNIIKELSIKNPLLYKPILAGKYNDLAILQNEHEATANFSMSLKLYQELADIEPESYLSNVAILYSNLAFNASMLNQKEQAIYNYKNSVKIYRQLVSSNINSKNYINSLASTLNDLSWCQYKIALSDAINNIQEAINIYLKVSDTTEIVKPDLAICLARMVRYKILSKEFTEAERFARKSVMLSDLLATKKNLAHSLLFQGKFDEAFILYKEIINNENKTQFASDFDEFQQAGVWNQDVDKIKEIFINQ